MKLKSRIIIILLIVIIGYVAMEYGIQRLLIFPSFVALEHNEAKQDIERCIEAIRREVQHLNLFVVDWSTWDDTYNFIEDRNPEYIESNLNYGTFKNSKINLIYYYNNKQELVWGQAFDLKDGKQISMRDFEKKATPAIQNLFKQDNVKSFIKGILMTEHGPMLVSSRPIIKTNGEGPIRGTLVMGRFLDDAAIKTLVEQTRVDFKVLPIQGTPLPLEEKNILNTLTTSTPVRIVEKSKNVLYVYTTISDLKNTPILLIKAHIPRAVTIKGATAQSFAIFSIFSIGFIVLVVIYFIMQKIIIDPITALTRHITTIKTGDNMTTQLSIPRSDEFGILAREFNHMVNQVHNMQTELKTRIAELSSANVLLTEKNTELVRAQEALKTEQNRLAAILDGIPIAIFVIDTDHRVVLWNRACEVLTGIARENVLGKPMDAKKLYQDETKSVLADLVLDMDEESIKKYYGNKNLRKVEGITEAFEVSGSSSYFGNQKYLYILAARLRDAHGRIIGAIETIQDITEKENLQKQLLNAQKMEAIGTLAGGVAHDLNNVLAATISYPELLLLSLPGDNPMRKPLAAIKEAGEKAAAIVSDLLTLARRGVNVSEVVNFNTIIADYLSSPFHDKLKSFNPHVEIECNLQSDLLNTIASPVHLTKTIMNLIANAAEALPHGGKVIITTENRYLDTPVNGYDTIKEGEYCVLTVKDNGTGISKEDLPKIFEPFFTKKVMGRSGTGLGLAVVRGTVQDYNGYIEVSSALGTGTTFTLYFPGTRKELNQKKESIPIKNYSGNGERILVVDDVAAQREVASHILTKLNYAVETVASGEEAVEYVKSKEYDLILLDMIMEPGIDGLETYRKILEVKSKQKAIIVSGFSETEQVKKTQMLGAGAYVKKPYTAENLGMAIKAELAR